jgi:outer membrane protein TolC
MTQRTIGWMQEVPNAAKRAARAQGAGARAEREQVLLEAERLGLQREVAAAWAARYYAERQLELFQTLESENRLLRETVSARVAAGKSMPADATMARQDAVMLADRRDELQRARTQAQATLKRWLGDDATQPLAGAPPSLALDPQVLRGAVERQPELLVFDPMARMTQAEAAELVAAKHGDWNWQVSYSRRNPAYGDMVSFAVGIELPLWSERRQDPQIAAKLKESERIGAEREDLLRRRREEIDLQLAELDETGAKLARLQATSVPLAGERVALAMAAYESGRGDLAAVLAARRERAELGLRALDLESRAFALRARLNYLTAEQTP